MKKITLITTLFLSGIWSCKTQTAPTENQVFSAVQQYLDTEKEPHTVMIGVGTIDFSGANAQQIIPKYQQLAKEGYISFGKKKKATQSGEGMLKGEFIDENPSKSKHLMQISVLDASSKYVVHKSGGKYFLKSSAFSTNGAKLITVEPRAENKYKVVIELALTRTPFAILEDIESNKATKSYLIKPTANTHWEVEGELKK